MYPYNLAPTQGLACSPMTTHRMPDSKVCPLNIKTSILHNECNYTHAKKMFTSIIAHWSRQSHASTVTKFEYSLSSRRSQLLLTDNRNSTEYGLTLCVSIYQSWVCCLQCSGIENPLLSKEVHGFGKELKGNYVSSISTQHLLHNNSVLFQIA